MYLIELQSTWYIISKYFNELFTLFKWAVYTIYLAKRNIKNINLGFLQNLLGAMIGAEFAASN